MIKAILSDLDGTLCDTRVSNTLAYKKAIYEITSRSIDEKELSLEIKRGESSEIFLEKLYGFDKQTRNSICNHKKIIYNDYLDYVVIIKDSVDLIQRINPRYIGIVTTASQKNFDVIMQKLSNYIHVDFSITSDDVIESKPNGEPYLRAYDKLKIIERTISKSDIAVLEDTENGIQSALNAGLNAWRLYRTFDSFESSTMISKIID